LVTGADGAEAALYHARLARPALNVCPRDSHNDEITLKTNRSGRTLTVATNGRVPHDTMPSGHRLN
jgi:hypothetical protein